MPFVYVVECSDKTLYTGWAVDVIKRLAKHNAGTGAKYTQRRRPVKLVYIEELPTKSAALKRERFIKSLTRAEKLKLVGKYV